MRPSTPLSRAVACCAALSLVACAHPARYEARPVDPAASARALLARGRDDAGLRAFMIANGTDAAAWPPVRWRARDLTLLAFYYHPDLDLAWARAAEAQAAVATSRRAPVPSVSLDVEHHSVTPPDLSSPWMLGFSFDFTWVTAGKRDADIARAEGLAEAARLDVAAVAWEVRRRATERRVALFAARRALRHAEVERDLRRDYLAVVQRRFEAGAVGRSELSLARLAADDADVRRLKESRALDARRAELAAALGIPDDRLAELELDESGFDRPPELPPLGDLQADALVNRLEVRRAIAVHAAADAALKLEVARQYPDIGWRPGFVWDQGDRRWVLGASIPLPLPHANAGPIAQAAARRETEARVVVALQAGVLSEVENARRRCLSAREQWQRIAALEGTRAVEAKRSQRRFEAGDSDRLDLLATRIEHLDATRRLSEALAEYHAARSALEGALQRPLDREEAFPLPAGDPRPPVAARR
jgi:outer membrane protein, heavy metal efflux system